MQRTAVNTTTKLLLLTHAFEVLDAELVGFEPTTSTSPRSAPFERLGAKRDGVLRHHTLRRDGTVRDTVMYSITAGEWPRSRPTCSGS